MTGRGDTSAVIAGVALGCASMALLASLIEYRADRSNRARSVTTSGCHSTVPEDAPPPGQSPTGSKARRRPPQRTPFIKKYDIK